MFGFGSAIFGASTRLQRQPETGASYASHAGIQHNGLVAGTRLATNLGWRPVEAIAVGDELLTFDHGPQRVSAVSRELLFTRGDVRPVQARLIEVPAQALGNALPLTLLPDAAVMIESDVAEELFGCPFALVPARALVGYRGIGQQGAPRPLEVVTLHCEEDEIVYAEGGALVFCPAAVAGIVSLDALGDLPRNEAYSMLDTALAQELVAHMIAEDSLSCAATAPDFGYSAPAGRSAATARVAAMA